MIRSALIALAALVPTAARAQDAALDFTGPMAVKAVIVAVVLLFALLALRRTRLSQLARDAATFVVIFVALVAAYAYRADIEDVGREVLSAFVPGMTVTSGEEVIVRRRSQGHFVLDGTVGGTDVEFLFDTGASTVVLTADDAGRAGYDIEALDFRIPVMTAGGMTEVAPVRIDELTVGGIRMEGVRAAVARPGDLDHSLLGMTFLNRLDGYTVRRDRLVLIP